MLWCQTKTLLIYFTLTDVRICREVFLYKPLLTKSNETLAVSLSSRIAVIMADVLVLVVTWSKSLRIYMDARRCKTNLPVATLLVRDGESIMMFIFSLLNVGDTRNNLLFVSRPCTLISPSLKRL